MDRRTLFRWGGGVALVIAAFLAGYMLGGGGSNDPDETSTTTSTTTTSADTDAPELAACIYECQADSDCTVGSAGCTCQPA